MKKSSLLTVSIIALVAAIPATAQTGAATTAQDTAPTNNPGEEAPTQTSAQPDQGNASGDIVITAQRQSQRLQDVPIAVSAFTAQNLEKQQIVNPLALQQSLPNVTFTKTNFTSSSFTIRGIGDLCVGTTCDSATAVHVNDMPLVSTRLFESEFYDLERVEVLRGPQGTLFGRNATSGVVNFITAKPDLSRVGAAGEFEYGNFHSKRAKAMINLPITDTIGVRVAGLYLKRDGYTHNLYNDTHIDDRDLYSVRGTLSWEPSTDTRIDLIGYYFHERDNRNRIQKQLCHRDPTGVLGCLPDRLGNDVINGNSTLAAVQSSSEFLAIATGSPAAAAFGLQSLYGPDTYRNQPSLSNVREVYEDYTPTYFAEEEQYQAKIFHDFGKVKLNITGGYARNVVDSTTDFNQAVEAPLTGNPALATIQALGALPAAALPIVVPGFVGTVNPFTGLANTLLGANGTVCQSAGTPNAGGVYSGATIGCYPQSLDPDRSLGTYHQWSVEAHVDSNFDGPFNFLLGGIFLKQKIESNDYYVNAFGLDYAAGILPALAQATGEIPAAVGNVLFATPYYRNNEDTYRLKSYGAFGEAYFEADKLKLTLGLRYNHDEKFLRARTTYLVDANGANPLLPYGATDLSSAINYAGLDYDPATAGIQPFAETNVDFTRVTGRAVLDYRITRDNLIYASYSRGYKSGGINPPLSAGFAVPTAFRPEKVDSFEIGSKNTFGGGQLRLNLTGFYYKYRDLQLARIVSRTAVNDNVDADIYGVEAEAVISPVRALVANLNVSYLHTKIAKDEFLANPQDPSGYRSDAVIIKDATNAANCAVVSNAGSAAAANGFVTAVNTALGLRAPTAIPGIGATGAYSVCSALQGAIAAPSAPLSALFNGGAAGALPFTLYGAGVPVNIRGNRLPQAPTWKMAAGVQYAFDLGGSGFTVVPRADVNVTGGFYASVFNQPIDRVEGYTVVNAQVQLNAPDDRFFVRGFIQNAFNSDAITGQGVGDQSSGLFTNIFTLEPRRYGVAAGFKF